jgi:hypothetical protein
MINAHSGFFRWWETNLDQMERQSVEELVRDDHGVLVISWRDDIQVIVPLNLPTKLLDERLKSLFLNGPQIMARLH